MLGLCKRYDKGFLPSDKDARSSLTTRVELMCLVQSSDHKRWSRVMVMCGVNSGYTYIWISGIPPPPSVVPVALLTASR